MVLIIWLQVGGVGVSRQVESWMSLRSDKFVFEVSVFEDLKVQQKR